MNKKHCLRLLCAILAVSLLAGCGAGTAPKKEATETVFCMTGMTYAYGDAVTQYSISYEDGTVCLTPQSLNEGNLNYTYVYDRDGKLLATKRQDQEGNPVYSMTYTYDENGNLTEILQMDLSDDTVASRNVYEYNDQGSLLRETYYARADRLSSVTEYTYDAQGFLAEDLLQNDSGETLWKHVYTCDDTGRILTCEEHIMSESFDAVGLLGTFTCSYDDQGRLVSNTWAPARNSSIVNGTHLYAYDDQGRLTRHQYFLVGEEPRDDYNYAYDESGYLLSSTDLGDGGSTTLEYGELTLPKSQAATAKTWTETGATAAFVAVPEFES